MRSQRLAPALVLLLAATVLSGCEETKRILSLTWSPDGLALVYVVDNEAWLLRADDARPAAPLTDGKLAEPHVAFTPDSRSLIFAGTVDGSWDLMRVNLLNGVRSKLNSHPAKDWHPMVTPSGRYVLFFSDRGRRPDIWALDLTTNSVQQLTHDEDLELDMVWAGSDSPILYRAQLPDGKMVLRRLEWPWVQTHDIMPLPPGTSAIALSPDHTVLATSAEGRLSTWEAQHPSKGKLPEAFEWGSTAKVSAESFAWLDAEQLVVSRAGTLMRTGTSQAGNDVPFLKAGTSPLELPAVSPDGKRVACVVRAGELERGFSDSIIIVDRNGRNVSYPGSAPTMLATSIQTAAALNDSAAQVELCRRMLKQELPYLASERVKRHLVSVLLTMDRPREALEVCTDSLHDPVAAAQVQLLFLGNEAEARRLLGSEDGPEAVRLKTILDLEDRRVREWMLRGEKAMLARKWQQAADALRLGKEPPAPIQADYVYRRASILQEELDRPSDAVEAYRQALELFGTDPRAFESAMRAAALCRNRLKDPERARVFLRQAISRPTEQTARARTVGELLDLELAAHHDTEADALVKDVMNQAAPDKPQPAVAVRVLSAYDKAGKFARSNEFLREFLAQEVLALGDLRPLLEAVPVDQLAEFVRRPQPWALPDWMKERARICLERVLPDQALARELSKIFEPQTAASLRLLREHVRAQHLPQTGQDGARLGRTAFPRQRPARFDEGFELAMSYLIANRWLDEGQPRRALEELRAFCRQVSRLSDEAGLLDYLASLPPEHDAALAEFLLLEREAGQGPWQAAIEPLKWLTPDGQVPWPQAQQLASLQHQMLSFPERYPGSPLAPVVTTDLARTRSGWWRLRTWEQALNAGPALPGFASRHKEYMDAARQSGHAWLAVTFSNDLVPAVPAENDRAWIHLACGQAYHEDLADPDRALADFDWVVALGPQVAAWAPAQWEAAQLQRLSQQYAEAVRRYRELIQRAPNFKHVTSGEALLAQASCLDALGQWHDAEPLYVKAITTYRDLREVRERTLLKSILPRLSEQSLRDILVSHPADLRQLSDKLEPWQRRILDGPAPR